MNMQFRSIVILTIAFCSYQSMGQTGFGFSFQTNEKDSVSVLSVVTSSPAYKTGL